MEAAEQLGIRIPRLCYHPDLSLAGSCRVCVVDVKGMGYYMAACSSQVWEGMEVQTNSPEIRQARRDIVELLIDNHNMDCQTCERDGHCELQNLAYAMGVRARHFEGKRKRFPLEMSSALGGARQRKVRALRPLRPRLRGNPGRLQPEPARPRVHHGRRRRPIWPTWTTRSASSAGSASTSAPRPRSSKSAAAGPVWEAIANPEMHVVVQTAPSIRAAIGEGFGLPPGTPATGQMVTALAAAGFRSRLRHRLRRRPDDHRGSPRVPDAAEVRGRKGEGETRRGGEEETRRFRLDLPVSQSPPLPLFRPPARCR